MNSTISRTLKALTVVTATVVLVACGGASSTVDAFHPTRVIGLGDGYNDIRTAANAAAPTVREGAGTNSSVVEQVATYFGQTNVVSQASAGALVSNLAAQIDAVGTFGSGDLVVITVGTFDVKAGTNTSTATAALVTQVQRILNAGATHVLVMPVLDLSRTPWGRTNGFSTTATADFNNAVNTALSDAFGGRSPNRVIYANASGVTSLFLTATSTTTYSPFTDTGFDGTSATTPACGNANAFVGCEVSVPTGANRPYTTMLFADGIHLTPAGNRWVAQYMYNATSQGWR